MRPQRTFLARACLRSHIPIIGLGLLIWPPHFGRWLAFRWTLPLKARWGLAVR